MWSGTNCGTSEPASIPTKAASNPASCCGNAPDNAGLLKNNNQVPSPNATASKAPWVVARLQYKPNTSGTKAPTSGTW